jgi:putative restriction endonuclease
LRGLQPGRPRNVATVGRAVRPLSSEDLQTIFEFGFASELDVEARYPAIGDQLQPELQIRERATRLVATAQREAAFRDDVLAGYRRRCAITGFSAGTRSPTRMFGLLDAAHIRPVWANGPDNVANGIALTPTLHRLFDRGLFTIRYEDDRPVVLLSPRIEEAMIKSQDGTSKLALGNGTRLLLPESQSLWPHPNALAYHQAEVYVRD